jgi:WD40-like Beta Propeller Repeat/Tetratricopeptide repeat
MARSAQKKNPSIVIGAALIFLLSFSAPLLADPIPASSIQADHDQHVIDWLVGQLRQQLYAALYHGEDQKALFLWEQGVENYSQHRLGLTIGEYAAWQLASLYVKSGKYDQAIELYEPFYADRADLTVEERAARGEQLIFGQVGGSKIQGAIGKAQCPLCHGFQEGMLGERAPNLFKVYSRAEERLQDPRYHLGKPQDRETVRKEACPGCGTAATAMEYLAESVACPNCYIVAGYGRKGTDDTDGGCPVIHQPPISLTIPELIAVETWILKQEGVELPLTEMRKAHEKFIPSDELGKHEGIKLASLYEAKGNYPQALSLIEANYPALENYEKTRNYFTFPGTENQRLVFFRDNQEQFISLKQQPNLVERFPLLLRSDRRALNHLDASRLGVEYVTVLSAGGEAPRWSPDGKSLLFTSCDKTDCKIRLKEPARQTPRTLIHNAAYGDWSPDGKQVVYISKGKLFRHELFTGETRELATMPSKTNQRPHWASDGKSIELLQRLSPSQPCRKVTLNLSSRTWKSETPIKAKSKPFTQSMPDGAPYDVIASNETSLFCGRPSQAQNSTQLRQYLVGGQADKVFSLKSIFGPKTRFNQELVWSLNKRDDFALLLFRNARNSTISPDSRWVAYEFCVRNRSGECESSFTQLFLARFQEVPKRVHEFVVNRGDIEGVKKGMILHVRGRDEWMYYPPIGAVQVVQTFPHQSVVRSVIETHHPRETKNSDSFYKSIEAGDRVIIPNSKAETVLLDIEALSSSSSSVFR